MQTFVYLYVKLFIMTTILPMKRSRGVLFLPAILFCATRADVAVNGPEAILSKNGKRFYLKILTPAGAKFTSEPAKPFTQYEKGLEGITMIHCNVPFKEKAEIKIELKTQD